MSAAMLESQVALVTGGTRGLGRAIGLELGREGARAVLTHRWGSADEGELVAAFERQGAARPEVVESDASDPEAVRSLMARIREQHGRLDIVVSNVAFAKVAHELDELKRSSFELSLRYSAWPVVDLVQAAIEVFGTPPRRVIAVSSLGADVCPDGYDIAGSAKAAMEMLCRYLALRLAPMGSTVNVLRTGYLDTASSRATFGDAKMEALAARGLLLDPALAARACVALTSSWMDGVTGQVLNADGGASLRDPIHYISPAHDISPAHADPVLGRAPVVNKEGRAT